MAADQLSVFRRGGVRLPVGPSSCLRDSDGFLQGAFCLDSTYTVLPARLRDRVLNNPCSIGAFLALLGSASIEMRAPRNSGCVVETEPRRLPRRLDSQRIISAYCAMASN